MKIGKYAFVCAAGVFAAMVGNSAEYRLERQGDALAAFADGRRFAVISPVEDGNWKIDADASGKDFIRFVFTPKAGEAGTFQFPEIRLDGSAASLKAVGSQGLTTLDKNIGSAMYLAVAERCRGVASVLFNRPHWNGGAQAAPRRGNRAALQDQL